MRRRTIQNIYDESENNPLPIKFEKENGQNKERKINPIWENYNGQAENNGSNDSSIHHGRTVTKFSV